MRSENPILWLVAEDCDDDFALLQHACAGLSRVPKLHRVTDGAKAQEYLSGQGQFRDRGVHPLPSLVLSDLNMPHMDGLELLAWFKSHAWPQSIEFVVLTGSSDPEDQDRALSGGASKFLQKSGCYAEIAKALATISEPQSRAVAGSPNSGAGAQLAGVLCDGGQP